jgi:hypothetical protein
MSTPIERSTMSATHDSPPSEFRYWANQDKPKASKFRRIFKTVLRFDPDLPADVINGLGLAYFHADPVAEAFVDEVYLGRGAAEGRKMLELALARGVSAVPDAPESMKRLFAEFEKEPDWFDAAQAEIGAKAFRRYGSAMFSFLGSVTLEGYEENSLTKPLILTGAYAGDTAQNRFLETAAFWIDVSEPGGMAPGCAGRMTAMRVRIMHVFVRRRLLSHPEWKVSDWGVPISQGDAITTLVAGSLLPGLALQVMGFRPTRKEILAMMHFWRYVGHILGVQPKWFPENLRDGVRYLYYVATKSADLAGQDGIKLAQSYTAAFAPPKDKKLQPWERLKATLEYNIQRGYVGLFVMGATKKKNSLPSAGLWMFYPLARFPFLFVWETFRRILPPLDALHDRFARWERKRWLDKHLGKRKAQYTAVESFTR